MTRIKRQNLPLIAKTRDSVMIKSQAFKTLKLLDFLIGTDTSFKTRLLEIVAIFLYSRTTITIHIYRESSQSLM